MPGSILIDVVEGSDSDRDHQSGKKTVSKDWKKQIAPVQTTFHCWTLTKAAPRSKDDAPSWKRAERVQMSLSSDELGSQVKKQLKIKSLTEMYEALSSDQRQQVEVLLKEKRGDETNKHACWEIAAIHREVRNNMRTRIRETTFIRVILNREDKRKVESTATEQKAAKASVASNISDLNNLSESLLKPINHDHDLHTRKKSRAKARKDSSEDLIEVMAVPNNENPFAINNSPMLVPLPSDQPTWSNSDSFWPPPSVDHGHDYTAQHQFDQWRPQQAVKVAQTQQLQHVQNALTHIPDVNYDTHKYHDQMRPQHNLPSPWSTQRSPGSPPAYGYNSNEIPTPLSFDGAATHGISLAYKTRPTGSEQDYFGQHFERTHGLVAEPFFAKQPQHAHNNPPAMTAFPYSQDPQAQKPSPNTKIEVPGDTDWPDYDPTMERSPVQPPHAQQHKKYEKQSGERLRREDVLFWRTQTQLSDSRSASSLDDQSSTLASPEQTSPLTSVSGDGNNQNRVWSNEPEFQYHKRDESMPGRFGQQLAAHNFLGPNQNRQREQTPIPPRRAQSDFRPPTGRHVSFDDEPSEFPNMQRTPPHMHNTHNPNMYTAEVYTGPSAPDPPEPNANFQPYHPQRYQPRQHTEPENASMLESLSDRLDNMELRQAESATRRAVEAAQKRREAEKKEAYERGIEDAMAWKARSGGYGGFD